LSWVYLAFDTYLENEDHWLLELEDFHDPARPPLTFRLPKSEATLVEPPSHFNRCLQVLVSYDFLQRNMAALKCYHRTGLA
jgi:hypothetical protein